MPKWLNAIGSFLARLFNWKVLKHEFEIFANELMPEAIQIVTQLDSLEALSNEEKRADALKQLRVLAVRKSLSFAGHFVELLLQMAVAKVRGTIG